MDLVTSSGQAAPDVEVNATSETSKSSFLMIQLTYGILMFVGCLVFYLIPVKLMERHKRTINGHITAQHSHSSSSESNVIIVNKWNMEYVIQNCNCMGAGIFVSLCFLGLMPVVDSEFKGYFESANIQDVNYPIAEFTTLVGFFLVLFLEEFILICRKRCQMTQSPPILILDDVSAAEKQILLDDQDTDDHREDQETHELNAVTKGSSETSTSSRSSDMMSIPFEEIKFNDDEELNSGPATRHQLNNSHRISTDQIMSGKKTKTCCKTPDGQRINAHHDMSLNEHHHNHSHLHSHSSFLNESGFTFFILMFATSVHSIFEGLALGLIKDTTKSLHIFIGIILHEVIVAAALGLNSGKILKSSSSSSKSGLDTSLKFGILFSSTVPLGIILGVAVGFTPGPFGKLISAVFQGLAAGTFLHVAFCELIPAELNHSHGGHEEDDHHSSSGSPRIFRICLIFTGFLMMALLTTLTDH